MKYTFHHAASVLAAFLLSGAVCTWPATFPGADWETRAPAEVGLDSAKLEAVESYLGGRGCIVRHGCLVYTWGDCKARGDVASAAKPWYSTLLFKAVEEGRLNSLDTLAVDIEPRLRTLNAALGYKDAKITFRHFANQTSCYGVSENPGTAYDYNDWQMGLFWDTLFLGVYGATYANVDATILHPKLTGILECQDDPTLMAFGTENRPGRLAVSPRDFARFGLLYLNRGTWNGTQVISEAHAALAVSSPLPLSIPRTAGGAAGMIPGQRSIGSTSIPDNQTDHDGGYSWLWWVNGVGRNGQRKWPDAPPDVYACLGHANGKRGMAVMPSQDIVLAWNDTKLDSYPSAPHPLNPVFQYVMASTTNAAPRPMTGQIVVDPEHPNRMVYHGVYQEGRLKPCFFAGPGDPEDFFYNDTTNNLSLLKARGARCTYITAFLDDFGGGSPGSGSALAATLDRWDNFITELENAGVITVFLFFDDSEPLPPGWEAAVDAIVNKLEHHKLLIWSVAEEYAEALSPAQVSAVADRIRAADDHGHVIGVHQNSGTRFDFNGDLDLEMFLMQHNVSDANAVHGGVTNAWTSTGGQKILNLAEIADHAKQDRTTVRRWNWAAAMGGASAVQVLWMGRASDDPAWNDPGKYEDCARLMDFMESAALLNTLAPRDDLALGATRWVLANPGAAYIAYATSGAALGLKGVTAGTYRLRWLDIPSGTMALQTNEVVNTGDQMWPRPSGIGDEAAVYIVNLSGSPLQDTTPPTVQSVTAGAAAPRVIVVFSEPVETSTATLPANYLLVSQTSGLPCAVHSAALGGDGRTVTLDTDPLFEGLDYVLTVKGVRDRAVPPNTIAADSQAQFAYRTLVACYGFEEGSGTTAADASGCGLNGTLAGPTWVSGCRGEWALEFDGVNDRVDLGNPPRLGLTGAMTVAAWVWIDGFAGNGRIVNKQGGSGSRGWSLNVEGSGYASFQVARDANTLLHVNGSFLPLRRWVHLAGTYEPGIALRLFVDGRPDRVVTASVPASQYNPSLAVAIGDRPVGGTPFKGRIDDVRIYSRALTAVEVAGLGPLRFSSIARRADQGVLDWTGQGQLEWASALTGGWTRVIPVPVPPYSIDMRTDQNRFFRLEAGP